MAKGWMTAVLTATWLCVCGVAVAQPLPGPGPGPGVEFGPDISGPPGYYELPSDNHTVPTNIATVWTEVREPTATPGPWIHVTGEYLLWWLRPQHVPQTVTIGDFNDPVPGALGQPGTEPVGFVRTDYSPYSGGKVTLGIGVENDYYWSMDGSFFALDSQSTTEMFTGDGSPTSPVFTRPFFNVVADVQDADPITLPYIMSGGIQVKARTLLYGGDANFRYYYWGSQQARRMTMLMGYRTLILDESLRWKITSVDMPGFGFPGNEYVFSEEAGTQNMFHGGQLGFEYESVLGPITLAATCKVGLGAMVQTIKNSAHAQVRSEYGRGPAITDPDNVLFVSPFNVGRFSRTRFAVTPECNLRVSYDFNQYVRILIGYSFLYVSNVIRPGDQIDRRVNVQPVGGTFFLPPAPPPPTFHSTDFWAHGLDAGIRFSF